MGSDTHTPEAPTLLRTKLHRSRLAADVITRSHLLERLNRGFQRRATLVSAPAGFGKTTLLSIARLQATQKITEIRMDDLRFTPEEIQAYLQLCMGADVPPEMVAVLAERTEGWAVGLRLACLALRDQDDYAGFLKTFRGTDRYIMEYLVDEVLLLPYYSFFAPSGFSAARQNRVYG